MAWRQELATEVSISGANTEQLPGRLLGIDLARFVAIVGMMSAHLLIFAGPDSLGEIVTSGFPSTLFAVLGGFGVVFASRRYLNNPNYWIGFVALAARGLAVIILGLLIGLLPPHPIAVVLAYFGVAIICVAFAWRLPSLILAGIATCFAVIGSLVNPLMRSDDNEFTGMLDLSSYPAAWKSVFFTGTYPVITWIVYLLVGMLLARVVLRGRESGRLGIVSAAMLLGGAVVGAVAWFFDIWYRRAVAGPRLAQEYDLTVEKVLEYLAQPHYGAPDFSGWDGLLIGAPHTGSLVDILRTGGAAVAIIGLFILLTYRLRKVPVLLRPFSAAGSAPLTIYTFHVCAVSFAIAMAPAGTEFFEDSAWWLRGPGALGWQVAVVLIFGAILAILGRRGPLEFLVSQFSKKCAVWVEDSGKNQGLPENGGQSAANLHSWASPNRF